MNKHIYIVHGWAYNIDKWQGFIHALTSRGVKADMLKVPGLSAPLEEEWTIDDYVEWLKKEIDDKPAIILGHSNGGRISMHLAAKYPSLVRSLILVDSAGIPRKDFSARTKRVIFKHLARVGKTVTANPKARKVLYRLARQADYVEATPLMRAVMSNMLESDYEFDPSRIAVPTNIIWGSDDTITPLALAKELENSIKGSRLHIISGARHSPQYSHADELSDIVEKILK